MKIRPMKKNEMEKLSKIMEQNYSKEAGRHVKKLLRDMFKDHSYKPHFLVAEEQGEVKGFVGYAQSWMNWRVYQVFLFNVSPKHQGNGIGTKLLKRAIDEIKAKKGKFKEGLLVLLTTPMPNYYTKRFGFKTLMQFRKKEAHLMALSIEK